MSDHATIISDKDAIAKGKPEAKLWREKIEAQLKAERKWREEALKAVQMYEGEKPLRFNIFFSSIETQRTAVFNAIPVPDIRRRFGEIDPIAKRAAEMFERHLTYRLDTDDTADKIQEIILDASIAGRGVMRIRYEAQIEKVPDQSKVREVDGQFMVGDKPLGADTLPMMDKVKSESITYEPVEWDCYIQGPAKRWDKVPWIAFAHDMTRDQLAEMGIAEKRLDDLGFGASGQVVNDGTKKADDGEIAMTVPVYEIWDKSKRRVIWLAKSDKQQEFLREDQDPYELTGFFPVLRLQTIKRRKGLIPICPWSLFEQLLSELEAVEERIAGLVDQCRKRGLADPAMREALEKFNGLRDGQYAYPAIPDVFKEGKPTRLSDYLINEDLGSTVAALAQLYMRQDRLKSAVHEVTGISDILRGATDARETLGAQEIKANWGAQRVKSLEAAVEKLICDAFRMDCELTGRRMQWQTIKTVADMQQFGPTPQEIEQRIAETIEQQTAQSQPATMGHNGDPAMDELQAAPVDQQSIAMQIQAEARQAAQQEEQAVEQLMRDPTGIVLKIDIETGSTIRSELQHDQETLTNLVGMAGQFGQAAASLAPIMPEAVKGMMTIFSEAARRIVRSRRAEDAFDDLIEGARSIQPPGQPNPEQQAQMQAQQQAEQQRMQAQKASDERKTKLDEMKLGIEQQRAQAEMEDRRAEREFKREEMMFARERLASEIELQRLKNEAERLKAQASMVASSARINGAVSPMDAMQ